MKGQIRMETLSRRRALAYEGELDAGSASPARSFALPDRELVELRHVAGALGAVGRNLNQITRVAHQTGRIEGLANADLREMLEAFSLTLLG